MCPLLGARCQRRAWTLDLEVTPSAQPLWVLLLGTPALPCPGALRAAVTGHVPTARRSSVAGQKWSETPAALKQERSTAHFIPCQSKSSKSRTQT